MARPRGYIEDYNPRAKTRELLDQVQQVFDTYRDELPLTGRQVFYRLVGAFDYPKDEAAYKRLMEHLVKFRRQPTGGNGEEVVARLDLANRDDAMQAEALPPDTLAAEVRQAVEAELDMDTLEKAKSDEAENRELFDDMMRRLQNGDDS